MSEAPKATQTRGWPRKWRPRQFSAFRLRTFPSQLFWFAITFGALYYYMAKRFLPRVEGVIERVAPESPRTSTKRPQLQQHADAAAAAHDKALADARAEAQTMAHAAREKIAGETEARRKALEGELAAKLEAAEAEIATRRAAAMSNVAAIAEEAAGAIVERLIGRRVEPGVIANAVNDAKAK